MMKKIILLLTMLSFLGSCKSNITPEGAIIEEQRPINDDFITLEVSSGIQVEFVQSTEVYATVNTFESVQDYVIIKNAGTTLKVYLEEDSPYDEIPALLVRVFATSIRIIKATQASKVTLTSEPGTETKPKLNITSENFEIHLEQGSSLKMGVEDSLFTNDFLITMNNGSRCTITGRSESLIAGLTGGSILSGLNLTTEKVEADVNMRSLMEISVSKEFLFVANGASIINYFGNAKGSIYASGSSKIEYLGVEHKD